MATTGQPRVRAGLAGAVCATAAVAAHVTAGGEVTTVAAALTLLTSVGLAPLLLDRAIDPARTLALCLVAQVVWHAGFVLSAPAAMAHMSHHVDTTTMAAHHLLAAGLGTVVAVGYERCFARAADWLAGILLPRPVTALRPPTPHRAAPAYAALARVPDDDVHDPARPLRAPPFAAALG
ncbi:hypothetical protein [Nocardioides marmoraquaticus]